MPAKDILIYANWELTPLTVTMADPDCNSVEGGPEFHYGDVVSISCTSPEFVEWSCDDPTVVFADKTSSTTTFTMGTKSITINHSFKSYIVTFNSPGPFNPTGAGSYRKGDTVTVDLNGPSNLPNYEFIGWNSTTNVTFADPVNPITTFTMPDHDVLVLVEKAFYPPQEVTVVGSTAATTGSGSYSRYDTVTVNAGDKEGYRFVEWTSVPDVIFEDYTHPTTTFTMPESAVEVTANWEAIPLDVFVVDHYYGSDDAAGAGKYVPGETVTIHAGTRAEFQFAGWITGHDTVIFTDASMPTTTFTMPSNAVTVAANWTPILYNVNITGSGHPVTGAGQYPNGETVQINAGDPATGYRFSKWEVVSGTTPTDLNVNEASTSFTMVSGDLTLNAVWEQIKYSVTVDGSVEPSSGTGMYAEGATVTINAAAMNGLRFVEWDATPAVTFADATNSTTTFTMPASDVVVTAVRERVYDVTVTNSQTTPDGSGSYGQGDVVTVNANPTNFHHWEVVSGTITLASTSTASTTFTMPATAVEVKAVYNTEVFHTATVDGVASQHYVGEKVSIDAGTKEGYVFDKWTATPDVQFVDN